MSDAALPIMQALDPLLRTNAGVIAAFGANKVRIYNLPPPASLAAPFPYITIGLGEPEDEEYEGIDAGVYHAQLHVWSRPDPRSTAEAAAIATAVKAAASNIDPAALPLTGFVLKDALPLRTRYLDDPDGMTVHAIVEIQFSYDPV